MKKWVKCYAIFLVCFFGWVLADSFLIERHLKVVEMAKGSEIQVAGEPVITETSYEDENIHIEIKTLRVDGTTVHLADVQVSHASLLKAALAGDVYGRNITKTVADMADAKEALLAINGDYYGFSDSGYVLRNGVAYRGTGMDQALVIGENGDFALVQEGDVSITALEESGAWQVLSFGPGLVENGKIIVGTQEEINGKSTNSNPRTAIGQMGESHYLFLVSDGRTGNESGLSLYQVAKIMQEQGCQTAYNLDGGGSSTMVFMGNVINTTVGGKGSSERKVSDIVYIGYR